jgi:hypothetical protein
MTGNLHAPLLDSGNPLLRSLARQLLMGTFLLSSKHMSESLVVASSTRPYCVELFAERCNLLNCDFIRGKRQVFHLVNNLLFLCDALYS